MDKMNEHLQRAETYLKAAESAYSREDIPLMQACTALSNAYMKLAMTCEVPFDDDDDGDDADADEGAMAEVVRFP